VRGNEPCEEIVPSRSAWTRGTKRVNACFVMVLCFFVTSPTHAQFLGKDAAEWSAELARGDEAQRRHAAFALGKLRAAAVPVSAALKRAAQADRSAKVREAAAYALGEIALHAAPFAQDRNLQSVLKKALRDGDPLVRRSACYALGCLGNEAAAARTDLEATLKDEHPEVRQTAAWALGYCGDEAAPALRAALGDADAVVVRDAAASLGQLDPAACRIAVNDLAQLALHADVEVRKKSLLALIGVVKRADAKGSKITGPLQKAVIDGDEEVRRSAAFALCNIGGKEAAPATGVLLEALRDGDLDVKRQAAAGLGNIGAAAERAVPDLIACVRDGDVELRWNAALALGGIGPKAEAAVEPLAAILMARQQPTALRSKAAVALSMIGPVKAAEAALPKLLAVASNPMDDRDVRERTMLAIRIHNSNLRNYDAVPTAFMKILTEPRTKDNSVIRQNCAYLYGMVYGPKSPPEVFPVLLEFLQNESLTVYSGTATVVGAASQEATPGKASSQELTEGDGRRLALDALSVIGPNIVRQHPEILEQVRRLADSERTTPSFRKQCKAYLRTVMP
jgi:HEAT repeat protein